VSEEGEEEHIEQHHHAYTVAQTSSHRSNWHYQGPSPTTIRGAPSLQSYNRTCPSHSYSTHQRSSSRTSRARRATHTSGSSGT
jgi:hypothetical protein